MKGCTIQRGQNQERTWIIAMMVFQLFLSLPKVRQRVFASAREDCLSLASLAHWRWAHCCPIFKLIDRGGVLFLRSAPQLQRFVAYCPQLRLIDDAKTGAQFPQLWTKLVVAQRAAIRTSQEVWTDRFCWKTM